MKQLDGGNSSFHRLSGCWLKVDGDRSVVFMLKRRLKTVDVGRCLLVAGEIKDLSLHIRTLAFC